MSTPGFICRACRLKAEGASMFRSPIRVSRKANREFSKTCHRALPRSPGSFASGWDDAQHETPNPNSGQVLADLGVHPDLLQDFVEQGRSKGNIALDSAKADSNEGYISNRRLRDNADNLERQQTRTGPPRREANKSRAPLVRTGAKGATTRDSPSIQRPVSTQRTPFVKRPPRESPYVNSKQDARPLTHWNLHHRAKEMLSANKSEYPVTLYFDGRPHRISPLALRELCSCERCVDPSTKQKLYNTADIPKDIHAKSVVPQDDCVDITWQNDLPNFPADHTTTVKLATISNLYAPGPLRETYQPESGHSISWTKTQFENSSKDVPYDKYMNDDHVLFEALRQLQLYGLLFLTGVPEAESSVSTITERIGPLKETFYGRTWDVRSVPQAKNVAYTSQDLGFHMDLLYLEQPPHLQILHCIRASNSGGINLFADAHRAARALWKEDPPAVDVLCTPKSVGFHYNHHPDHHYEQSHSVISRRDNSPWYPSSSDFDVDSMAWSPPFQSPLVHRPSINARERVDAVEGGVELWRDAAEKLNKHFHDPKGIYQRKMQPGECVIFANRKVLHARTGFEVGDVGKERWLRGCYMDKDPFLSKLRVLGQRFQSWQGKPDGGSPSAVKE